MARGLRKESRTRLYHVVTRGNNGEKVFQKQGAKRQFLSYMQHLNENAKVEIYAYCVMDDHVHLMIRANLNDLSCYMHDLKGQYSQYYNGENDRKGHVFQGRFESECIEKESGFWSCLRYIHNNPVQAGISKEIYTYPYSSVQDYIHKKSNLIHPMARKVLISRYRTRKEFFDFHKIIDDHIFLDMEEEKQKRKCDVLKAQLELFLQEKQILLGEFLLNPRLKKGFAAEMHEKIKLPYSQIYETFEMICLDIGF